MYLRSEKTVDFYNEQIKDYSFPSSHTSFYLSLFLPFALAYRKYLPLLLFIPFIIIAGRVIQNEHYLSDVLCSMLIVLDLCFFSYGALNWIDNSISKNRYKKI